MAVFVLDRRVADGELQPIELKIDPGSRTSGLALVRTSETVNANTGLAQELVRFDPQQLENPEIAGVEYQQGELAGYEVSVFLANDPTRLAKIQAQSKRPLRDAAAVNATRWALFNALKATGRGSYQRTRLTRFGFPRGYLTRQKRIHGFQTGDRVKAIVTKGKKVGTYAGRVAVRASGSFNIQTTEGLVQGISHRDCTLIQRSDGYGYSLRTDSD